MDIVNFLTNLRKERKLSYQEFASNLSVSTSTYRRFEKRESKIQFNQSDKSAINRILSFNEIEKESFELLLSLEHEDFKSAVFKFVKRYLELEDPKIFKDKLTREIIYKFLFQKQLTIKNINDYYIGNYNIFHFSILLNMPKLFKACLYYSNEILSFSRKNPRQENSFDLLSYLTEDKLNRFKKIVKKFPNKINCDINDILKIEASKKEKNYVTPLFRVDSIKNNNLVSTQVDYVQTPRDLMESNTIALVTDHRHNYYYKEIKEKKFELLVPQNTYFIVAVGEKPVSPQQHTIIVYQNKILGCYLVEETDKHIKLKHFTGREITLKYGEDDFKYIGTIKLRVVRI